MACFLDGFPRYPKMHPCGLVLSRQDMHEITPCFTSAKGYPTSHFDMDSIEAVGLIKMDILAQGGLAVMRDVTNAVQSPTSKVQGPQSRGRRQKRNKGVDCRLWSGVPSSKFEVQGSRFKVQSRGLNVRG